MLDSIWNARRKEREEEGRNQGKEEGSKKEGKKIIRLFEGTEEKVKENKRRRKGEKTKRKGSKEKERAKGRKGVTVDSLPSLSHVPANCHRTRH